MVFLAGSECEGRFFFLIATGLIRSLHPDVDAAGGPSPSFCC